MEGVWDFPLFYFLSGWSKVPPLVQEKGNKQSPRTGRPLPGYSLNLKGELVSDPIILKILKDYRGQKELQNWGGYKVLSRYLLRDHSLRVNTKKVYSALAPNFLHTWIS